MSRLLCRTEYEDVDDVEATAKQQEKADADAKEKVKRTGAGLSTPAASCSAREKKGEKRGKTRGGAPDAL